MGVFGAVIVAWAATNATARHPPVADCGHQSIATSVRFGGPQAAVLGPMSLPAGRTYANTDITAETRPEWLKTGAAVLRGHTVTMKIAQTPPRTTGFIGMPETEGGTALAGSKARVTLTACGPHQRTSKATDGRAVTFWSGGFAKRAGDCRAH